MNDPRVMASAWTLLLVLVLVLVLLLPVPCFLVLVLLVLPTNMLLATRELFGYKRNTEPASIAQAYIWVPSLESWEWWVKESFYHR